MALEFIPNQPIIFTDPLFADQTCLNADVRQYAQLAQPEDETYIQWINTPDTPIVNCTMMNQPDVITGGTFDNALTGWSEYDISTGTPLGVPTHWSYTGSGAAPNNAFPDIALYQSTSIPAGNIVLISWEQSDPLADVYIGVGNTGTNTFNVFNYSAYPGINVDGRRCVALSALTGGDIIIYGSAISTWSINNIIVRDVTLVQCFVPDNPSLQNWTYVESINGYQKLDNIYGNPLTLAGATLLTGVTYKISFSVQNMSSNTFNSIGLYESTTLVPMLVGTENKAYTGYYTHTLGPANIYVEIANSFGTDMEGAIIYDVRVDEMCYDYRARISFSDGTAASIWYDGSSVLYPLQFFEDRIVWAFTWQDIESIAPGGLPLDPDCYKIQIENNCSGGGFFTSYTIVNYKQTHDCSVVLKASSTGNAFGFFFNQAGVNFNFYLQQRLRLLQFNPIYPIKTEEYLFSTGTYKRTFAQTGKVRTAWFDYVDEPTHDVIRLQLLSDNLIIGNQLFYFIADNYEPEWAANGKYNLAQSRVDLVAVPEPVLFNKSC
jgi:hypothetical protein